jgi:rare lipoprotein A
MMMLDGLPLPPLRRWSMLLVVAAGSLVVPATMADAKTPGATYCFHRVCHRVKTIAETVQAVGQTVTLKASFYDDPRRDRFNPRTETSSGERFRPDAPDNAASPI